MLSFQPVMMISQSYFPAELLTAIPPQLPIRDWSVCLVNTLCPFFLLQDHCLLYQGSFKFSPELLATRPENVLLTYKDNKLIQKIFSCTIPSCGGSSKSSLSLGTFSRGNVSLFDKEAVGAIFSVLTNYLEGIRNNIELESETEWMPQKLFWKRGDNPMSRCPAAILLLIC